MTTVLVPALLDGVRVDRAVALLAEVSRSRAAELVGEGRVSVDGRPVVTRSTPLAAGTTLTVDLPAVDDQGPVAEPEVAFAVVHQDDQLVVIDKPAGLVVHPGAGHASGTLVGGLLARFPDLAELGTAGVCDPERPGIVHRLDRGTSGLLVVARTEPAYRSLASQLAARTVGRRYLALAAGQVTDQEGVVDAPIGRSSRTPTKMAVSANGRPARTGYRILARYDQLGPAEIPATLLALTLETGRTHQIRVHLAAIGHPVIGDDRYGPRARVGGQLLAPGRLFLHAARLGFEHPGTGEWVQWTSPLPPDLAGLIGPVPEQ
ncbi:MAG TPA: RluA family pseudouridine synthase [Acidimicrobiales bacterium]|jgi:23S rRNA pseudouridine1911/1915/1917 synthase|nr:RluA family pseudouridine synthase [Acidimicrobiales bacterium]